MFFCDFCEIFKSTFLIELLRVTASGSSGRYLKMTLIEAIVTLIPTLNIFLSVTITLEAAIQKNLKKSWRFSREISVVGCRYSETILFGIHSNFTYDRSSRSKVFFKIGVLKNWPAKRDSCEICKVFKKPFLPDIFGGCFSYNSETYDMVKLYLSLNSSFFSI